jgi:hypothetical protein
MISTKNVSFALQYFSSGDAILASPLVRLKGMQCKCSFYECYSSYVHLHICCTLYVPKIF